jgi:hypothetical protein
MLYPHRGLPGRHQSLPYDRESGKCAVQLVMPLWKADRAWTVLHQVFGALIGFPLLAARASHFAISPFADLTKSSSGCHPYDGMHRGITGSKSYCFAGEVFISENLKKMYDQLPINNGSPHSAFLAIFILFRTVLTPCIRGKCPFHRYRVPEVLTYIEINSMRARMVIRLGSGSGRAHKLI